MTQEDLRRRTQTRTREQVPTGLAQVEALTLDHQPAAVVRARVRVDEVPAVLARAFREVEALTGARGVALVGPAFGRFAFDGEAIEVEAGFPVDREIASEGCVVASDLPGGTVVRVLRRGTFEQVGEAYEEVEQWVRLHGCTRAGDPWEVYLDAPGSPAPRTVVHLPFLLPGRA